MAKSVGRQSYGLLGGVSLFAILVTATICPAWAQQAGQAESQSGSADDSLQEIVVTGMRKSVEAAAARKEKAEQIIDSVVADDIGKLPDASVTEVLQRISGVTISHYAAAGDPDHYSAEGSGVAIRGLSQVNSLLNGHESFSASNGRALSFEDVPPELMAAVDVYKSQSANLIEGGIGGTVDLRTHMPFDFDGEKIAGSIKGNYGDFAKTANPEGSLMYSNTWETPYGRFGALFDVSYSHITTRSDTIQVEPYFPQTIDGEKVYIPGGVDWRSTTFDRKRTGMYGALQWEPTSDLEFHVRAFRSRYDNQWTEYGALVQNGADATPASDATNIYNSNGALVYTSDLRAYNWDAITQNYGENPMVAVTDTAVQKGHSVTGDYSGGFTWTPTNDLKISSDLQFVDSNAASTRYDLYLWSYIPGFSLDTRGGIPKISSTSTSSATNASNYGWYATMDHREEHVGRELAWNTDAEYKVGDSGWLRAITGGVRLTRRTEMDADSGYNWTALTPYWNGSSAATYASTTPSSYITLNNFSNFFRGMTSLPSALYFPSVSMVECYPECLSSLQKEITGNTVSASSFKPYQRNNQTETTETAYVMAKFADDTHLFAPMSGSIGVRMVGNQHKYDGYVDMPDQEVVWNGSDAYLGGGYEKRTGSSADFNVLPSLNVQFLLTPQIHWRIALGQALNRPSFSQMNPGTQLSAVTDSTHNITGWAGAYGGNPNLKAEKSDQADTSLEWYGNDGSEAHLALFYKAVHNYITTGVFSENYNVTMPDGSTQSETFQVTEPFNGSLAIAKGFEIGGQKFFDFLPHPFDGFGLQANFTYVYSKAPSDIAYDMDGKAITGLPMNGMSRYSYNLIGMYEKGPYSLRLAYNWRSKYLLATTANGTTGSTTVTAHGIQYAYALPVFNDDYGQLDGSIEYKIDDHFTVSFEATNLTDAVTHTVMGVGSQEEGRSWFINDRRYMMGVRFAY